jgi:hypothetical protein
MKKGESRRILLKAKDQDGDPIHFQIQNLDSLRALFPANAIGFAMDGDSLVLDFSPGSIDGDFRFRIALLDPSLPSVIQNLTVSVGAVNRSPAVAIQGPVPGMIYLLKEGESLSMQVFRDTEAPLAPVKDTGFLAPTNNLRPSWVWKSGGRGGAGVYRYKLGDTLWTSIGLQGAANTFTPSSALSEGKHTLFVEERDSVGNWSSPGMISVETDYTPPNIPLLTSTGFHTLNPKPTWQWESGGKGGIGTYRMKLDDSNLGVGSTIVTAKSFTPSIGFASGTRHVLYLQERDEVGNWSEPASFGVRIHGQKRRPLCIDRSHACQCKKGFCGWQLWSHFGFN